jgi:hypothetical protein
LQSIRYGASLRATAAITTAAFMITEEDKRLAVDHNKVKRAQEKVMRCLYQEFDDLCKKNGEIDCIFFDGREDTTIVMLKADISDHQFPSIIKEQHYTVCSEPGGRYLYHFTPEKGSKREKPAEVIANANKLVQCTAHEVKGHCQEPSGYWSGFHKCKHWLGGWYHALGRGQAWS